MEAAGVGMSESIIREVARRVRSRIEAEIREQIAYEIKQRCLKLKHDEEWVGYPVGILCSECSPIYAFVGKVKE